MARNCLFESLWDDSKVIRVAKDESSADCLQMDIDSVTSWTK